MKKKRETHGIPTYSKKYINRDNRYKSKSQHSILHRHEDKINEFKNKDEKLRTLNNKIKHIQTGLSKKKLDLLNESTNEEIVNKLHKSIRIDVDDLNRLEIEKKRIESGEDEIEYLLNSSSIILEYTTLEDRKGTLLDINDMSKETSEELENIRIKQNELVDSYLSKFNPGYINHKINYTNNNQCPRCNMLFITEDSFLVCPDCGLCSQTVEHSNELSYKELQDYDYRTQFTYDKKSHLEDWIRRFQSKENRSIPQEILDKLILEANKERIQDLNTLTEEKVKRYLKKLNLNEYYDNVIGIINRINGRPPFKLTPEVEDKIKTMFQQIQEPYEKFKPNGRKNFLSYSYTLHKFFQILGLHEFATYFPLLKSIEKLRQQDIIFKKIVLYMAEKDPTTKWVFYPSV